MSGDTTNPMGSIFDEPEEDDEMVRVAPHDPMHSALSSGIDWEEARVSSEAQAKRADALDSPRGQNAPALPPSDEFLCCQVGPCKHYGEFLAELDSAGARLLTEAHRVCTGFGGEAWTMDEGTRFACTHYAPPWWSLRGLRRRIIGAHRVGRMRRGLTQRWRLTLAEQLLEQVYQLVKGDAPELPRPQAWEEP